MKTREGERGEGTSSLTQPPHYFSLLSSLRANYLNACVLLLY